MKQFNINDTIHIQITDNGWKHLLDTVGVKYIKSCITPQKTVINNTSYHTLQMHEVFNLFPISNGSPLYFKPNILINDNSLNTK